MSVAIHPLIIAVSPHRIAGGIGLLLIGASVASVTFPSARTVPFYMAGMTPGGGGAQNLLRRNFQENNGGTESEASLRSFPVASEALPPFRVTNIAASLRTGEQFDVAALSQSSEVVGTVVPLPDDSISPGAKRAAPRTYAARWQNGKLHRLPIPPGAHRVVAGDINDRGDVGAVSIQYRRGKPSFNRVLLYRRDAAYKDFGTLNPEYDQPDTQDSAKMRGVSESLLSLNNRGTIIALVGSNSWFRRADGTIGSIGDGIAFDLNNNETAVGFVGAYASGAVMWRNVALPGKSSVVPLLPTNKAIMQQAQSYWRGSAESVNDKGDTVVSVPIDSSNGFRRLGRTAYYLLRDGKLQLIAQMRGYQRARVRINDSGDIIGFSDTDQQSQTIAPILYREGKMYDLTHAAQNSGWKILGAIDINNNRQILAYGVHNSRENIAVPILLTPVR